LLLGDLLAERAQCGCSAAVTLKGNLLSGAGLTFDGDECALGKHLISIANLQNPLPLPGVAD
jgi:hypothetical protein